jgi:uncharacterized protein DUF5916/cellulose/xylan binding protein with CBM9 domain
MIACLAPAGVDGQTPTPAASHEIRALRTTQPPIIDGALTDEAWSQAEPASDFTQRDPDEGMPATERTEIRILYDDEALYIGARMFDSQAVLIARRLSSRDGDADADHVDIYLDPMHDHLTGVTFRVSASNVQRDAILHNDTWQDSAWDAVWQSQVSVDARGWSAEMRMPLSQLRFPASDRQTWGVNVERFIHRKNETVWLEFVPKDETGLASRMTHLTGLDGLRPKRHLALLPYAASRAEFIAPSEANHPFNDGSRASMAMGADLKWGVTSNLTLDGTINPDFGQVEVDPAVINLSEFETFFQEKRAFFLEGAQIFNNFGVGGSNSFWGFNSSDPSIFYSRRIGRAPQVSPSGDFTDSPAGTTILGATKLTGKTGGGWSIGMLDAVTDRETARTQLGLESGRADVEPLTNYFVARVQRELGRRAGAGFITSAVTRRLDSPSLRDGLASTAYVFGTDAHLFLDSARDWVVTGKIAGSRVSGSTVFIESAQRAAQRYYQRPDAPQVQFDPGREALNGFSGRVVLNRNSGLWQVNAALWGVSPGFESNDLGFHGSGDRAGAHGVSMWRGVTPDRFTRSRSVWVAKWWTWNFNRELQSDGWHAQGSLTFRNYWYLNGGVGLGRRVLNDRLTRGGPLAISPAGGNTGINAGTDSRRWVSAQANTNYSWNEEGGWNQNAGLSFSVKPSPMLTLSTGPQWRRNRNIAQYVDSVTDPTALSTYGGRYVFGVLDQRELSMTTRISVILTPAVSVQVYAQPLLAVGDYANFKELAQPRTFDFLAYASPERSLAFDAASKTYTVDPDGAGPAQTFSFDDPDFNVKSLRMNAVFRWELKPGSTFYAVWTRYQRDEAYPGRFAFGRDARAMFAAPADDVVLVKMAYWIGR